MSEPLSIGNELINVGDIVTAKIKPQPGQLHWPEEMTLAVLGYDQRSVTFLTPYEHLRLSYAEQRWRVALKAIDALSVIMEAAEAIPSHSGAQQFQLHETLTVLNGGVWCTGPVIAALRGIVAIRSDHQDIILVGGAKHFTRPTD